MKIIFRLVLLAAVIVIGIWLWTIFFPGPEKVIRKELIAIARDATSNPNQNPLVSAVNAQKLTGYFSTNIEVQLDMPGYIHQTFSGRDEIMRAAVAASSAANGVKIQFLDITVAVGADKQSATAELTAQVQIGGDKDSIIQEMKFTLEKTDGKWLITRVETVRTLT